MPMSLNHAAVASLSAALKQRRQLTFGEQQHAKELLAVVERAALAHYDARYPNREIDPNDSRGVRELKRRGLMEAALLADDSDADLDDEQRALIQGVLREACGDYNQAGHHHSAVNLPSAPAPKAMPKAVNTVVEDPRVPELMSRIGILIDKVNAMEERLDNMPKTDEHASSESSSESATSVVANGDKKEG